MPSSAGTSGKASPAGEHPDEKLNDSFPNPLAAADDDVGTVTFSISRQELLSLQIRGFLDASDEVDIPTEVAEDLLETLPPDPDDDNGDESGNQDNEKGPLGSEDRMEEDEVEITAKDGEISVASVFNPNNAASGSWTAQEIKWILHHLKERGSRSFVAEYVIKRNIPIPKLLHAFGIALCPELANKSSQTLMYLLEVGMSFQLRKREKLPQYNTFGDAYELIAKARKILVLTGAGISVSCGIPDFRSKNGLYATLKERGEYDLDDPQQMFDINYFREQPAVFYSFASQIYPAKFQPSLCHTYIRRLEDNGQLLRNYTQNIDTLESKAGIERVIQCHGSFATASCLACRRRVPGTEIEDEILSQRVPICSVCSAAAAVPAASSTKKKGKGKSKGKKEWELSESEEEESVSVGKYPPYVMKPDITFFGEKLDDSFDKALEEDRDQVDLLLVIGTSLKVAPVADILSHIPHSVPQILINKTPIKHINPDIILLGDADVVVRDLMYPNRTWSAEEMSRKSEPYVRVGNSHVTLFDGAEGGKWLEDFKRQLEIEETKNGSQKRQLEGSGEDGEEGTSGESNVSSLSRSRLPLPPPACDSENTSASASEVESLDSGGSRRKRQRV